MDDTLCPLPPKDTFVMTEIPDMWEEEGGGGGGGGTFGRAEQHGERSV